MQHLPRRADYPATLISRASFFSRKQSGWYNPASNAAEDDCTTQQQSADRIDECELFINGPLGSSISIRQPAGRADTAAAAPASPTGSDAPYPDQAVDLTDPRPPEGENVDNS